MYRNINYNASYPIVHSVIHPWVFCVPIYPHMSDAVGGHIKDCVRPTCIDSVLVASIVCCGCLGTNMACGDVGSTGCRWADGRPVFQGSESYCRMVVISDFECIIIRQ